MLYLHELSMLLTLFPVQSLISKETRSLGTLGHYIDVVGATKCARS